MSGDILEIAHDMYSQREFLTTEDIALNSRSTALSSAVTSNATRSTSLQSVRSEDTSKQEKDEHKDEDEPVLEPVRQFALHTSAHGWGHLVREHLTILKLVWLVLTVLAYIANGMHISLLMQQFLRYPTEQVSQVQLASLTFPSVTLCNIQPMSFAGGLELIANQSSRLAQWTRLTEILMNTTPEALNITEAEHEFLTNRLRQPIGYYENIGDEVNQSGHSLLDFLLRCTYPHQPCDHRNFTLFQSPTYFNCYTLNSKVSEELIAKATGPQNGISLILYLESDNGDMLYNGTYHTLSQMGNAAGLRVIIHPPGTLPTPIESGFDIPPGFSSSIGITVRRTERLTPPYGECHQNLTMGYTDEYIYSQDSCLLLCQQTHVLSACNCLSSTLPDPPGEHTHHHYCGFFNNSNISNFFDNLSCEAAVLNDFSTSQTKQEACNCHLPCKESTYQTDISYSSWPLDFAQKDFYEKYVLQHPQVDRLKAYTNLEQFNTSELIQKNLIRKNFARVNMYFKSLVVEKIVQRRTYEVQNLFSDMGGTFGLWIGVSMLTWCEIFECGCKLLSTAGKHMAKVLAAARQIRPGSPDRVVTA